MTFKHCGVCLQGVQLPKLQPKFENYVKNCLKVTDSEVFIGFYHFLKKKKVSIQINLPLYECNVVMTISEMFNYKYLPSPQVMGELWQWRQTLKN